MKSLLTTILRAVPFVLMQLEFTYQRTEIFVLNTVCQVDPTYAFCEMAVRNNDYLDFDFVLRCTSPGGILDTKIVQFGKRIKKTLIFRKRFHICEPLNRKLTQLADIYFLQIFNIILSNKLECPIRSGKYAAHNVSLRATGFKMPLNMFYRPNSYFVTNITFISTNTTAETTIGVISVKWKLINVK